LGLLIERKKQLVMEASRHSSSQEDVERRKRAAGQQSSSAAQAASSLALLLREDQLLTQYELHVSGKAEEAAFSYAAALLEEEDASQDHRQRAEEALGEVDRKLALVESLAERVSRTSPEAVAGPLLRLHGYTIETTDEQEEGSPTGTASVPTSTTTLVATRERCDRLKRQGEVLEGVSQRVESSLQRGLTRIEKATNRLSRVLSLSASLKMILRLQFESSKLQGYYLDDLRDLTRAAASVAVIEDLLSRTELKDGPPIDVVEAIRPQAQKTAAAVRRGAAALLELHHAKTSSSSSAVIQLGATLQVYFHLGELPGATWSAVDHALVAAEKVSFDFWSPTTLSRLTETANTEAKLAVGASSGKSDLKRTLKKKLRDLRAEAASKWAAGVMDASLQVWNLHRVLCRKSDAVSRQVFVDVVSAAPIPEKFQLSQKKKNGDFSIFSLYWERLCQSLGDRLKHVLEYDNGKLASDVAALYPSVQSAAISMLGSLHDTMQAGLGTVNLEDATATSSSSGLLGGSTALDDSFLRWSTMSEAVTAAGLGVASADTWTKASNGTSTEPSSTERFMSGGNSTTSMSAVFLSSEWMTLQGNHTSVRGLFRLQQAFLEASRQRLCAPLQYMFPENVSVDEDGHTISGLPLLPSRYDIQKFDTNIRQELSLADPREGGGDLSAVTMIAENVVLMVSKFCDQAKNAVSNVGEEGCLHSHDGSATNALLHDLKVTAIMHAMAQSLRTAPDNAFLAPYRPAVTAQLEEATSMGERALKPALQEIEKFVKALILSPLCRALNRRVAATIGRMHLGMYMQEGGGGGLDSDGPSFVQTYLTSMYENISSSHLSKLPVEHASIVASMIASFSIYAFVSNASLIRPLGEAARLNITHDLADFELALEQLVLKSGGSLSLSQIENGKPYAELRAVRQMLFWNGLDDKSKPAVAVAKSLLREAWVKDVRPSTLFHYLFSFAPTLLSSPHHAKRMKVEEYAGTLVQLNGAVDDGEASAWMTTMACCDSYQQRESAQQGVSDGDSRVPAILMALGPLLRR
jgi:hypothetical protein